MSASSTTATVVRLVAPTEGEITSDALAIGTMEVQRPADGEVTVEVHALSLDPAQRVKMKFMEPGSVFVGGMVGRVAAGAGGDLAEGTWVTGDAPWATAATLPASALRAIEPEYGVPLRHHVGLLGLSGLTGYLGVTEVARPRAGEKMIVSGAFGGVGQVACQVAGLQGADVVGLVGSPEKVESLATLGVRALNYRDDDWQEQLGAWAPAGVDVFFDNVWGTTAARVVEALKPLGRIALCGQISGVEGAAVPPLPLDDWFRFVTRSLTLQGFRAADFAEALPAARAALADLYRTGEVDQQMHVVEGLEAVPQAFVDMLHGRTLGKTVVELHPLP